MRENKRGEVRKKGRRVEGVVKEEGKSDGEVREEGRKGWEYRKKREG